MVCGRVVVGYGIIGARLCSQSQGHPEDSDVVEGLRLPGLPLEYWLPMAISVIAVEVGKSLTMPE